MAEITTYTMENKLGCGLTRGAFLRRLFWPRKTSVHSLPAESSTNITSLPSIDSNSKKPPIHNSKGNRTSPSLASFIPPIFPSLRQKLVRKKKGLQNVSLINPNQNHEQKEKLLKAPDSAIRNSTLSKQFINILK
jgi:DnaJ family protein C protein 7